MNINNKPDLKLININHQIIDLKEFEDKGVAFAWTISPSDYQPYGRMFKVYKWDYNENKWEAISQMYERHAKQWLRQTNVKKFKKQEGHLFDHTNEDDVITMMKIVIAGSIQKNLNKSNNKIAKIQKKIDAENKKSSGLRNFIELI